MRETCCVKREKKKSMKKTKFDLYKSAGDAAATTLEMGPFETASAKMEVFRAENQAAEDWAFWSASFDERREFFLQLKGQPAPSVPPPVPAAIANSK